MPVNLVFAVLLGPAAALYDFCTNANSPPMIFVTQWNESFINHQITPPTVPPIVRPKLKKHVFVTPA
jgi:hypothetical protein